MISASQSKSPSSLDQTSLSRFLRYYLSSKFKKLLSHDSSNQEFSYVLQKIKSAKIIEYPFEHIYLDNVFTSTHFDDIINSPQVAVEPCLSTQDLLLKLIDAGYLPQKFPGCTSSLAKYLNFLDTNFSDEILPTCSSVGMSFRLANPTDGLLRRIYAFLASREFKNTLIKKFSIRKSVHHDFGIQKYLNGYEISPHPDIKKKALTYMLNINTNPYSESETYHTHYLKFKPNFEPVEQKWRDSSVDTSWVSWDWCETKFMQTKNNSLVIFSPSSSSLHAIKANYNDLKHQRTQIYGNLWYQNSGPLIPASLDEFA